MTSEVYRLSDPKHGRLVWLGQSARTTTVTRDYPQLCAARWMASLGDAIHRPRMLETVFGQRLRQRLNVTGPLIIDSGGFTMMMRNGQLPLAAVAKAFSDADAEVVISLDYPPWPSDTVDVRQTKYAKTLSNFEILSRKQMSACLAPVIHGVTDEELHANCEAVRQVNPWPQWVCVGGLVPLLRQSGQLGRRAPESRARLKETIESVRRCFPAARLHVLGVGSPRTMLTAFAGGADSVDSIGWRRAAGFGTIFLPGGTERFVADRDRKRASSRLPLDEADRAVLAQCNCPACVNIPTIDKRLENLAASYMPRAAHNAWILLREAETFDRTRSDEHACTALL
jgi:tRNA-guanine family transglycosylase